MHSGAVLAGVEQVRAFAAVDARAVLRHVIILHTARAQPAGMRTGAHGGAVALRAHDTAGTVQLLRLACALRGACEYLYSSNTYMHIHQ